MSKRTQLCEVQRIWVLVVFFDCFFLFSTFDLSWGTLNESTV